jgi:hypothetical protein
MSQDATPDPPERRYIAAGNLLDDRDEAVDGLKDWEVLRPGY